MATTNFDTITATTFLGAVTGAITGNVTGNVSGQITYPATVTRTATSECHCSQHDGNRCLHQRDHLAGF